MSKFESASPQLPVDQAGVLPWNTRLVPAEPTKEMIRAALDCQDADPEDGPECEAYYGYLAMLKAAPPQHVPMAPVGYLIRTETGAISRFSELSQKSTGCLPAGWTEEPVFTATSAGLPLSPATEPKLPEMSPPLLKLMCEALMDENPILRQAHAEELAKLLSAVSGQHDLPLFCD